jgi:UTP--glucose-1-phosphate uridylyltransferase
LKVKKALITAAGADQRMLPLQRIVDADGEEKSVLTILVEKALTADVDSVGVVVWPGDEDRYGEALGRYRTQVRFIPQPQALGYGYAIYSARDFVKADPFLHLVGDHLYVSAAAKGTSGQLVDIAQTDECPVSAVQPTREHLLPSYGTVGGHRVPGRKGIYKVETVVEKPTPTEAEQHLFVPGMRAGYYLCFFGMHVLTPLVIEILGQMHSALPDRPLTLSAALSELAHRGQYLAWETPDRRYDIGAPYGVLMAQLALALAGRDRSEVLSRIVELLVDKEIAASAGETAP